MITARSYLIDIRPTSIRPISTPTYPGFSAVQSQEIKRERQGCLKGMQKRTCFATTEAPSEETVRQTRKSPISTARDHVNSHAVTLHDKLAKIVVCCTADFMARRQNLHCNISSQHKLKSDDGCVPKFAQIKLKLSDEKGRKEGEGFQALSEKHSQVIDECQL